MPKNVTIKDIAREAGVSIALVSFVMNNRVEADGKPKYRVGEATRRRILDVAASMNYRPSGAARMLRQGRSHVIGVILSDMANIFYGTIAKELEKITYKSGYTLLFGSTEEDPGRFGRLIQSFLEKDVDGFIVVPPQDSQAGMEQLKASGKPYVIIDRYHPDYQGPVVLTDNEDAMRTAIHELQKQGAGKIEMVSYAMRISSMTDREKAFHEILGSDAHIYHLPFDNVGPAAEQVADEILGKGTDGVITASNVPGVALIKALFHRGVRIQKDIKFVGFDFSNIYGLFEPAIPYLLQPLPEISVQAAECLYRLINMKRNGVDTGEINQRITLKAKLL